MAAFIKAIKVEGQVVALALCYRNEPQRMRSNSDVGMQICLAALFPPDFSPAEIRQQAAYYYGYCNTPNQCEWGYPFICTLDKWPYKSSSYICKDTRKLQTRINHWPS